MDTLAIRLHFRNFLFSRHFAAKEAETAASGNDNAAKDKRRGGYQRRDHRQDQGNARQEDGVSRRG